MAAKYDCDLNAIFRYSRIMHNRVRSLRNNVESQCVRSSYERLIGRNHDKCDVNVELGTPVDA